MERGGRRPHADAAVSRPDRRAAHGRLGPAVPGGPEESAAEGRGVLGTAPRGAKGVRRSGRRSEALGRGAVWIADVDSRLRAAIGLTRPRPKPSTSRNPRQDDSRQRRPCRPARPRPGTGASRGSTDFGEYFTYFSFFIVVSGLLLSGLFFKLGLEQRVREIGLLFALGFTPSRVRRLLGSEGLVLAVDRRGRRHGRRGAVRRRDSLRAPHVVGRCGRNDAADLAVAPAPLVLRRAGRAGRGRDHVAAHAATAGHLGAEGPALGSRAHGVARRQRPAGGGHGSDSRSAWCLRLGWWGPRSAGAMPQTAAFFAAGGVLLIALLLTLSASLRRAPAGTIAGHGPMAVGRLGVRQATAHPGRSVLSVALIAFATFVIVSVGAFKRGAPENDRDPQAEPAATRCMPSRSCL